MRLRTAELSNWTGKTVAGPRSEFEEIIGRKEARSLGVYFLTGHVWQKAGPLISALAFK